jgi:hypothetical protein
MPRLSFARAKSSISIFNAKLPKSPYRSYQKFVESEETHHVIPPHTPKFACKALAAYPA